MLRRTAQRHHGAGAADGKWRAACHRQRAASRKHAQRIRGRPATRTRTARNAQRIPARPPAALHAVHGLVLWPPHSPHMRTMRARVRLVAPGRKQRRGTVLQSVPEGRSHGLTPRICGGRGATRNDGLCTDRCLLRHGPCTVRTRTRSICSAWQSSFKRPRSAPHPPRTHTHPCLSFLPALQGTAVHADAGGESCGGGDGTTTASSDADGESHQRQGRAGLAAALDEAPGCLRRVLTVLAPGNDLFRLRLKPEIDRLVAENQLQNVPPSANALLHSRRYTESTQNAPSVSHCIKPRRVP